MFAWRKTSSKERKTNPENPGKGVTGSVGFANAAKNWTETFDVVYSLEDALQGKGYITRRVEHSLSIQGYDFLIQPRFVTLTPLEERGAKTTTTVEVSHPKLFPGGVFEYQHASGGDVQKSLKSGFEQWISTDLPVFTDLFADEPRECTSLIMTFAQEDGRKELMRRVLLGPVAYMGQNYAPPSNEAEEETHPPFCRCCMFTNTVPAFQRHLESQELFTIRFFGMRNIEPEADCRINGFDWEPGAVAIRDYVKGWPDRGFEFRKQFAAIHTVTGS